MEEKEEVKLNLLRFAIDNASDFDEAKAYASLVFGFKEPFATRTPSDDEEEGCKYEYIEPIIEDGVYLVEDGFIPVRSKDVAGVQNPKKCDVMVSYHGHEWVVAKNDVSEDEIRLLKDCANVKENSPFYKSEIEALNDFNMKSCTDHLRKSGLCFKLDDDLYIPTVGQLAAMFLFRKELNKALEMAGGTSMKEEIYWSSSENNAWSSWSVNFVSGGVNYWVGKCGSGYVRPCKAFELKKKGGSK